MASRFSEKEKNFIKDNYKTKTPKYLASVLSREIRTVRKYINMFSGVRRAHGRIQCDPTNQEELGEFLGAFAGDGAYSSYETLGMYRLRIYLGLNEYAYANGLSNIINRLFGKATNIHKEKNGNYMQLKSYGKDLYKILSTYLYWDRKRRKTYTVRLKNNITGYPLDFINGFIRGLIATDGRVYTRDRNRIIFSSHSKSLAYRYFNSLVLFGIKPAMYKNTSKGKSSYQIKSVYSVYTTSNEQFSDFYKGTGLTEENKSIASANAIDKLNLLNTV